jgi:hypothetical protein
MTPTCRSELLLEYKKTYVETLVAENATIWPELRWMVNPDDYLRTMIYDPDDFRRAAPHGKEQRARQFCRKARVCVPLSGKAEAGW